MTIKIITSSRDTFNLTLFTDENVDSYTDSYFICVNATGWKYSIPFFKKNHNNVLNLYFDDIDKTGLKLVEWYNNTKRLIYAIACSNEQAISIKKFIDTIPNNSILYIYCSKGKSRSPAIEKFVREYRNKEQNNTIKYYNKHVYSLLWKFSHE